MLFFVVETCQRGCKAFLLVSACMHIMERGLERQTSIRQKDVLMSLSKMYIALRSFITCHKHPPTFNTSYKSTPTPP